MESLLADQAENASADSSWDDMLSIVKTLVAYGCLSQQQNHNDHNDDDDDHIERQQFTVTQADLHLGMLAFENS